MSTPGNVQPGTGIGRSSAPVARMTARARNARALRSPLRCTETETAKPSPSGASAHTVALGTYCAPARRKSTIDEAPLQ